MALGRATWVTVLCRKLRDWWQWVCDSSFCDVFCSALSQSGSGSFLCKLEVGINLSFMAGCRWGGSNCCITWVSILWAKMFQKHFSAFLNWLKLYNLLERRLKRIRCLILEPVCASWKRYVTFVLRYHHCLKHSWLLFILQSSQYSPSFSYLWNLIIFIIKFMRRESVDFWTVKIQLFSRLRLHWFLACFLYHFSFVFLLAQLRFYLLPIIHGWWWIFFMHYEFHCDLLQVFFIQSLYNHLHREIIVYLKLEHDSVAQFNEYTE